MFLICGLFIGVFSVSHLTSSSPRGFFGGGVRGRTIRNQ